ncbi:chaperonin 10-like protein [Cladochytrium replicatum]|nr:chaperonin 10-like protein [Cladochytrium replicatum]
MSTVHKAAVIPAKGAKHVVEDVNTPSPSSKEILVKVAASATNPVDAKIGKFGFLIPGFPFILGIDGAGTVEEVGADVSDFREGDRVAIFSPIFDKRFNTYQEYSLARPGTALRIPSNITLQQAATIPTGFFTASDALFVTLNLPIPAADASRSAPLSDTAETVLVWGGASSVGQYTVQLARLAGFRVIATASPKNFDLVRSLGASEVFDYSDSAVVSKIKGAAPSLRYGVDAVSLGGSFEKVVEALGPDGGAVATVSKPAEISRENVTAAPLFAGKFNNWDGKNDEAAKAGRKLLDYAEGWLAKGDLTPNNAVVVPGGLEGIEEGWALIAKGVSAAKVVHIISDL